LVNITNQIEEEKELEKEKKIENKEELIKDNDNTIITNDNIEKEKLDLIENINLTQEEVLLSQSQSQKENQKEEEEFEPEELVLDDKVILEPIINLVNITNQIEEETKSNTEDSNSNQQQEIENKEELIKDNDNTVITNNDNIEKEESIKLTQEEVVVPSQIQSQNKKSEKQKELNQVYSNITHQFSIENKEYLTKYIEENIIYPILIKTNLIILYIKSSELINY
jgi:hypothetical protein